MISQRLSRTKNTPVVLCTCCVLACSLSSGCVFESPDVTASPSPNSSQLAISVIPVERVEKSSRTKILYGEVVPVQETWLAFERSGRIASIPKNVGNVVAMGEVIASVEQTQLEDQKRQITESLAKANDQLANAASSAAAAVIQKQVQQFEGRLKGIEAELKRGRLESPFDGVIVEVEIEEEQLVRAKMPAIRVVSDLPPVIKVDAREVITAKLQIDSTFTAKTPDGPVDLVLVSKSELRGPVTGEQLTFELKSDSTNASWNYGDVVEIVLPDELEEPGLWIPLSSLIRSHDQSWAVYAAIKSGDSEALVERRPVDVLATSDGQSFVNGVDGSLADVSFIVGDGTHRIVAGQRVTVDFAGTEALVVDQAGDAN